MTENGKQKLEAMMDDILNLYVYSFNIILPSLMTQQSLRPGVDRKTMFHCTANVQGNHIYYNNN